MSGSGTKSRSHSGSETRIYEPRWQRQAAKNTYGQFADIFRGGGQQPGGLFQSLFQNQFGAQDYQNAHAAIQDSLSGNLGSSVKTAYDQLRPQTDQAIYDASNAIKAGLGPSGGRWGTDVGNNTTEFANRAYQGLGDQALTAGMGIFDERAKLAGQLLQQPDDFLARLMQLINRNVNLGTKSNSEGYTEGAAGGGAGSSSSSE